MIVLNLFDNNILIDENGWSVVSTKCSEIHYIRQNLEECNCNLRCPPCNICIHKFSCSCVDCSVKWNMCTHLPFMYVSAPVK
ncbi:hypothetical protein NQ314_008301 [Rhamnusium bicolor]|uniref:Uncharacterized protein n=1 Tax=Rhamnusium bicolor TaxID=1586634 RepID=A0AAV8YCZ2_9CUCU|nr:hypothetical protein NQ314_008301 [Rhamnusium bicolor]